MAPKRKTKIFRVWGRGEDEQYWVDLEVMDKSNFSGSQWPGLDDGNQGLGTLLFTTGDLEGGGTRDWTQIPITMTPESERKYGEPKVKLEAIKEIAFRTKNNEDLTRFFDNKNKPAGVTANDPEADSTDRKIRSLRFACNDIADDLLTGEIPKGSSGKQPPHDPDEYLKAVKDTDDQAFLWLDVAVVREHILFRHHPGVRWFPQWGSTAKMPGVAPTPKDPEHPPVMMDPYQVIVNFGPDGLAVLFHAIGNAAAVGESGGAAPDPVPAPPGGGEPPGGPPPPIPPDGAPPTPTPPEPPPPPTPPEPPGPVVIIPDPPPPETPPEIPPPETPPEMPPQVPEAPPPGETPDEGDPNIA